jgi:ubiquinone/menaquinone biosynthesis C-methylase UbiE
MSEPVKIQLGCGKDYRSGWINCDVVQDVRADKYFDLEVFPWPFPENYADEILLDQVLEHLSNTLKVMEELHRILKPGGIVRINVPYSKSDCAYQDLTHRKFFTEKTMDYFTEESSWNFYSRARFKILRAELTQIDITPLLKLRNMVPFRKYLRWFFWNMYDGVSFVLQKTGTASSTKTPA